MRILIFHGYLLHGTGSNVYNARLAEALVRAGHEVHLVCQDRHPYQFDWVDATGNWMSGELTVVERRSPPRATVYRPDIGDVLPVYVADVYEGATARTFPELTDDEIERYLAANVAAVRDVCARAEPDVALANHVVMGPVVLARALADATIPFAVKIHGSALEYTVKPHPRFLRYAREGLERAAGVLVGSRHTADSLWGTVDDPTLPERTRLGPPGVDVDLFAPRHRAAAGEGFRALRARLSTPALDRIDPGRHRLVVFVGKLIASKGVELVLSAWPLVARAHPDARLVVVGAGSWRSGLEALATELGDGDLDSARARRAEDGRQLPQLAAFLESVDGGDYAHDAGALRRVSWTGLLDHTELADLLPAAEATVVPSTFPEAFGMVAAEAAACGALPVVACHSGLAEVAGALAAGIPARARPWLSFAVGDGAVEELAGCLNGWLAADGDLRRSVREGIVGITRQRWSWDGAARTVIAAATGRLEDIPHP